MAERVVAFLVFDGVAALDLFGPADAFNAANAHVNGRPYRTAIASISGRRVVTESGVRLLPDLAANALQAVDTLILPGGAGLRDPAVNRRVGSFLLSNHHRMRRVVTICTGIYGLAPTGLLNGRRVTTHWRFAEDVKSLHPQLRVDGDALFVRDGKFYTSAGITAGVDLALALIEEDLGASVALAVARELVVYLKRPGGQSQFSEPLMFQTNSGGRMRDLAPWIADNLRADLRVERLAERACLSPRQFTRTFADAFGTPPGAFVEEVRLATARERLTTRDVSVEVVAASTGYRSADAFARAFRRRFGISPTAYRASFSHGEGSASENASAHQVSG